MLESILAPYKKNLLKAYKQYINQQLKLHN